MIMPSSRDLDAMHWEEITDGKEKDSLASRARGEQDVETAILTHIPATEGQSFLGLQFRSEVDPFP